MATTRVSAACLWVAACLLQVTRTMAQKPSFDDSYTGDATYYGDFKGAGACSFQFSSPNSFTLPWAYGDKFGVAMNSPQWAGSAVCGMCIAFTGVGTGAGNPIYKPSTSNTQYTIVTDLCPECKPGDLDQATKGDGRWQINWHAVQCNVSQSKFYYSFQGSNAYYLKMQISNARVPVQAVQIKAGTSNYVLMTRTVDNYWLATGKAPFSFPAQVTVTSMLGDTVTDVVPGGPKGTFAGGAQFPVSPNYPSVGGSTNPQSQLLVPPSSPPPRAASPPPQKNSPPPSQSLSTLNALPFSGVQPLIPVANPPTPTTTSPPPSPTAAAAAATQSPATPSPTFSGTQPLIPFGSASPPPPPPPPPPSTDGAPSSTPVFSGVQPLLSAASPPPPPPPPPPSDDATPSFTPVFSGVQPLLSAPSPPTPASSTCTDTPSTDGFTCTQQKGWGKCDESWMVSNGWCSKTCGRCS